MKTHKLITGALLSLILVVSLFIPAAAFSVSSTPDSVTVHLDSPEDLDYKNQPISIPAGYTFDDLTSISGVYLVTPDDGSDPYYLSFSDTVWVFQTASTVIVNVKDCSFINPHQRAFSITFASGYDSGDFNMNIVSSGYDGTGIVQLTFTFGEDPLPDIVLPDVPVEGFSVYDSVYTLIHRFVYGGVDLTADMALTLTLLATAACVFVVAIPFVLVIGFFKRWL